MTRKPLPDELSPKAERPMFKDVPLLPVLDAFYRLCEEDAEAVEAFCSLVDNCPPHMQRRFATLIADELNGYLGCNALMNKAIRTIRKRKR